MKRLPKGFTEGHQGDLACPHRDVSCCDECAKRPEIVEVSGVHYWIPDPAERAQLAADLAALRNER